MWAYYTPDQVLVTYTQEKSKFYCWGDKEVEFHRCDLCGCVTHYVTTPKCDAKILAVNMRMAENETLATIPVRKINGAAYWKILKGRLKIYFKHLACLAFINYGDAGCFD